MSDLAPLLVSYTHSLLWYLRRTWPFTLVYGAPLAEPSINTQKTMQKILGLLKTSQTNVEEVVKLLQTLPREEKWLCVVDSATGFDILQTAVIHRHCEIVDHLVSSLNCNVDCYRCSPPVHLAAYQGDAKLLDRLLRFGAKSNKRRGMCYPEPHLAIRLESGLLGYLGFQQKAVYLCASHRLSPVQCAIQRDNLECVKTLLRHHESLEPPSAVPSTHPLGVSALSLLVFACREGASSCIQYLVGRYPDCINSYMNGDTPLLAAVPWGEECVHILLESGADAHLRSEGIQETALHRLYRQNIDGLFTIYDTTKYLLTTGLEQEINVYTHLGETPLHMLVSHVSYTGGNYVDPQRRIPRPQLQESYQKQVVAAVRLLLEFNADPNLLNSPGLTCLSRLLHIGLKAVNPEDPCPCVSSSQPNMFIQDYRHNYSILADVINILLEFASKPNFTCTAGHTPLILMLQLILYDSLANICSQRQAVLRCFTVLLESGAQPNFTDATGKASAYSLISAICKRCLVSQNPDVSDNGDDGEENSKEHKNLRDAFAAVINDILDIMLKHGLHPNLVSTKVAQHLWGGHGNGLIELVRLAGMASTNREFEHIGVWLQTMLQWGADPDLEPYPSEPIICHCQSSIFLKKLGTQPICHYVHEIKDKERLLREPAVQRVLLLFYSSMSHAELQASLAAARSSLHLQPSPHTPGLPQTSLALLCDGSVDVLTLINAMGENPRSLKELARVAIYVALDRKLAAKVQHLPLPLVVKKYLLEPIF
ncbi:ankyrin repeat and socs box protein [Plakobranchus ocellatus]|uniref:Ankyrin repeat and socs box protein n=1 Tax=Plakobranchus ocellatus TaxID=259542 RepID=A0AAV3YTB5_9GAST|nr:ankyrin repeat and socs box protein [Plakobranchus ocellatus]